MLEGLAPEDVEMTPPPDTDEEHPRVQSYRLRKVEERLTNGARAFASMRNWIALALLGSLASCVVVGIYVGVRTERLDALRDRMDATNAALVKMADTVNDLKVTISALRTQLDERRVGP